MELEPRNRPQSVQEWLDLVMFKEASNLVMPKKTAKKVQLVSAVGMDYINLRNLLAAGKWREADEETPIVMLKVAGREKEGWMDSSSIDKFPCEDLRTIDQLWVKYSNGRFGFSVQKRIYQSLGGTREYDDKIWEAFGDRVGWRVDRSDWWLNYDELEFNTQAPEGHLPGVWWFCVGGVVGRGGGLGVFSRAEACKV